MEITCMAKSNRMGLKTSWHHTQQNIICQNKHTNIHLLGLQFKQNHPRPLIPVTLTHGSNVRKCYKNYVYWKSILRFPCLESFTY